MKAWTNAIHSNAYGYKPSPSQRKQECQLQHCLMFHSPSADTFAPWMCDCTNSTAREAKKREELEDKMEGKTKKRVRFCRRGKRGKWKWKKRRSRENIWDKRQQKTKRECCERERQRFRRTDKKKTEKNEQWDATVMLVISLWRWFDLWKWSFRKCDNLTVAWGKQSGIATLFKNCLLFSSVDQKGKTC